MNDRDRFSKLKQPRSATADEMALLDTFTREGVACCGSDMARLDAYVSGRLAQLDPELRARIDRGWRLVLNSDERMTRQ